MIQKECPKCEARSGLNIMKGEVTQLLNAATKTPMKIDWSCGFCGYKESETVYMGGLGGMQEEKSVVGTIVPNAPLQAARPVSAPKPTKASKAAAAAPVVTEETVTDAK